MLHCACSKTHWALCLVGQSIYADVTISLSTSRGTEGHVNVQCYLCDRSVLEHSSSTTSVDFAKAELAESTRPVNDGAFPK